MKNLVLSTNSKIPRLYEKMQTAILANGYDAPMSEMDLRATKHVVKKRA